MFAPAIIILLPGIKALPPEHPFHLVPEKTIRESLDNFQAAMTDMGIPYTGTAGRKSPCSFRSGHV